MKWIFGNRNVARYLCLLTTLAALLVPAATAHANGVPVDVFLSYLPDVSNWGPQNANGKAVVAVADQYVTLDVQGLPRLDGQQYHVWLESRADRSLFPVGQFNVGADGQAHMNWELDQLPYQEYRMLLISVEPDPSSGSIPSNQRSIAGLLPNKVVVQVVPGATPGASTTGSGTGGSGSAATTGARPSYLPVTGAPGLPAQNLILGISTCMLAASALVSSRQH